MAYLAAIGAAEMLVGPEHAEFAFVDLGSSERWTLRINDGRLPWWIFDKSRRVPGTKAADYFGACPPAVGIEDKTICETIECAGLLYERLARPLWLAALNTEPKEASAAACRRA